MAIFSTLIGLLAIANIATAQWQGPGVYTISSASTNLTLDLTGGSSAAGTKVEGWTPIAQPHSPQAWLVSQVSSATGKPLQFAIANYGTGTILTNANPNGDPSNNQVVANPANPSSKAQAWTLDTSTAGRGLVIVKSLDSSNQVLDLSGSGTTPGTPVLAYPLNGATGTPNQHWIFTLISN